MKKKPSSGKSFTERRREQLETAAQTKTRQAMEEAIGQLPGPQESETPEGITRELATAYYKETSAWMHRFSDVRSDDGGFFLLHEDNADAWRMQPGDLIQDVALNATPYWQVTENDHFHTKRVSLKPVGPNPFTTGVGAGGAKIYPRDIKVLTGEYEKERIEAIETLIERGEYKDISDVKYMLLGTVATNFGPNGPQGGWYNPGDYSCRGGRRRMPTIDIVKADAQTLRDLGFAISQAAIDGDIPDDEWGRFVEGPVSLFTNWEQTPPFDTEIFKKNMISDYESRGLFDDEWRKEQLLRNLDQWDEVIKIWQSRYGLSFQDIEALKDDGLNWQLVDKLKGVWRFLTFATQEEDPSNVQNAILMLNHQQSDVQMRAVARCLMYITSADDSSVDECIRALHRFIQSGHGDWLVNEQIINNAKSRQDAEMLIEATHLPDGTNRKYAYWGLTELRDPYVKKAVYTEDHPEALTAIAQALYKHLFLPGRAETYYLLEKLVGFMHEDQGTMNRVWARDGVSYTIQLAQRQGLDTDRALEALLDFDKRLNRNPDGELSDREWVETTILRMKQVVGKSKVALAANPKIRQNKFVLSIDEPIGCDRTENPSDETPKNPLTTLAYGGLPSGGGYQANTYMELSAQHIAEAAHCILGSLGKTIGPTRTKDWRKLLHYEAEHIQEEMDIINKRVFEYRKYGWQQDSSRRMNDPDNDYYEYVKKTVSNIRSVSPKIEERATKLRDAVETFDDVPHPIREVALACYDLVIVLAHIMEKNVADWPDRKITNPFLDQRLEDATNVLDAAVTDLLEFVW